VGLLARRPEAPSRYNPTMEASELLKQALTPPDNERADLAASLINSLDATVDDNVEAAWQEEISRRIKGVEKHKVKTIPWEEVREKGRVLI
jgi:putative addiction module component (TIGR02574 family)